MDDNEIFLRSLFLHLPEHWHYNAFVDPLQAAEFITRSPDVPPLSQRCLSANKGMMHEAVVQIDLDLIEQEINYANRFLRTSVLVVDYAMPAMDGLELFAEVQDANVQKILLTGVADEKLAVKAFNSGLIDCFVTKDNEGTIEVIMEHVERLQLRYFKRHTEYLTHALSAAEPTYFSDPIASAHITKILNAESIIEYYVVANPPGLLLVKSDGGMLRLIVLSRADMLDQAAFARRHGAPAELIAGLENFSLAGFFADRPEHYTIEEAYPWMDYVRRATRIDGIGRDWHTALVRNPPVDIDFAPAATSYAAFMSRRKSKDKL